MPLLPWQLLHYDSHDQVLEVCKLTKRLDALWLSCQVSADADNATSNATENTTKVVEASFCRLHIPRFEVKMGNVRLTCVTVIVKDTCRCQEAVSCRPSEGT